MASSGEFEKTKMRERFRKNVPDPNLQLINSREILDIFNGQHKMRALSRSSMFFSWKSRRKHRKLAGHWWLSINYWAVAILLDIPSPDHARPQAQMKTEIRSLSENGDQQFLAEESEYEVMMSERRSCLARASRTENMGEWRMVTASALMILDTRKRWKLGPATNTLF